MFDMKPVRKTNGVVSTYNPFREFEDLEKLFWGNQNEFWNRDALAEFKTDIQDTGSAFLLESDLPGFRKEDIKLDIHDDTLTITAERHSNHEDKDKKGGYVRCERSYGSYRRSFDVSMIDQEKITAKYENGVLTLTLPKKTETAPESHSITIE